MYTTSTDPLTIHGAAPQPGGGTDRPAPLSMLSAVNAVLRQRWTVVGTSLLVAVAVVAVSLLQPRTYSSPASFIPQTPSANVGGLSSVASQFGLNVNESANTDSPAFYADLLVSRTILEAVADSSYSVEVDGRRRTASLADLLEIQASSDALRRHEVLKYLRRHVGSSVTPKTGTVVLSVSTHWPSVSHQIAERMLALVSHFNRERRQSRAIAERRFTEQQLAEARQALAAAERQLEGFLVRNRRFSSSPTLEFEQERLAREVSVRSQRYMAISDAHERARLEEIRDTPVITILDAPQVAVVPDRRYLALKAAVGLTVGLVLGIALALVRHLLAATQRSRADEYAEFLALRRAAFADLKRPWRPLLRRRAANTA